MSALARKMIAIRLHLAGQYYSPFSDEELLVLAWITASKLIAGNYSYME